MLLYDWRFTHQISMRLRPILMHKNRLSAIGYVRFNPALSPIPFKELVGQPLFDQGDGHWESVDLRAGLEAIRSGQVDVADLELTRTFSHLGLRTLRLQARRIDVLPGSALMTLLAITDITEQVQAAAVLQQAHDELEQRVAARTHELAAANAALQEQIYELARSEQARQQLLQQLVTAQEEERRRIARELHDQLGQDLTALSLGLKALSDAAPADAPTTERVAQLQAMAVKIGQEVRTLAMQLRPSVLDDLGLNLALTNYMEQWSVRAHVAADVQITNLEGERLPLAVETTLYRLIQEALTNVLKHAQASQVSVIIERRTDEVRFIVEDDGIGFETSAGQENVPGEPRLGLIGMRERVTLLGGALSIESAPGSGTTIFARIPLAAAVQGGSDGEAHDLSG